MTVNLKIGSGSNLDSGDSNSDRSQELEQLVKENIEKRFLNIFGESGVNVLKLNLALDRLKSK